MKNFIQGERLNYFRPSGPAMICTAFFVRYTGKTRAEINVQQLDGTLLQRFVMVTQLERPRADTIGNAGNAASYAGDCFGFRR